MTALGAWKYHGARNDFLFTEDAPAAHFLSLGDLRDWVVRVCHRTGGIGADGVLFLKRVTADGNAQGGSIEALIVNSDGSLAGTCGNALRCVGLHALRQGWWDGKSTLPVRRFVDVTLRKAAHDGTLSGEEFRLATPGEFARLLEATRETDTTAQVTVGMGRVVAVREVSLPLDAVNAVKALVREGAHSIDSAGENARGNVRAFFVELSNPHLVLLTRAPDAFSGCDEAALRTLGRAAQTEWLRAPEFAGVPLSNVGFLAPRKGEPGAGDGGFSLVVYERGADLTQCCGSGAVAARAALEEAGVVEKTVPWVNFRLPGGNVSIGARSETSGEAVLCGPAVFVASLTTNSRQTL